MLCLHSSRHADGSLLYIISDNQNTIISAVQVFQTTILRKDSVTVAVPFGDQIDTIYSDSEFRTQSVALLEEEEKPPLGFIQNNNGAMYYLQTSGMYFDRFHILCVSLPRYNVAGPSHSCSPHDPQQHRHTQA